MPKSRRTKRLTDLELAIMQVVWEAQEPMTVRTVTERLAGRGRELAYTSVQTVMNILKKKGVLTSRPGAGRAHEYVARVSREEATTTMTRDLVDRLFGGEVQPLLAHLIQNEPVSRAELEGLKRRIEQELEDDPEDPPGDSATSGEEGLS